MGCFQPSSFEIFSRHGDAEATVMSKQKIGCGLVALAFALILILVRYATLHWLEVLAVPIMGPVALGVIWALSE
jgi:hypothetical protein